MTTSAAVGIGKPGTAYNPYRFISLRGGINNSVHDELINDDQLADARNYVPDYFNSGVLIKREGNTKHLANQQTEAGTSVYQGVVDNYFTTSTLVKTFTSNTDLSGGLTSTTAPDWASLGSMDILVNGSDAPMKITAGPVLGTLGGSPPTFKYVQEYHNAIFGFGHSGGILRHSDIGTTETWSAINAINFPSKASDAPTGLAVWNDALFVFFENSYYQVVGYSWPFQTRYSGFEEGCSSHRSIVNTPYGLCWWSKSGMVFTRNGFNLDFPTFRLIPNTLNFLNKAKYSLVHGVWHPRLHRVEMYVFNASATIPDLAIYYYPAIIGPDGQMARQESIWLESGVGIQMGASGVATISGVSDVYRVSASADGYLYKETGDNDDGTNITSYLLTKREVSEYGLMAQKRCEYVDIATIVVGPASFDYSTYIDNNAAASKTVSVTVTTYGGIVFGTSVFGPTAIFGNTTIPDETTVGVGLEWRKIQHRIDDQSDIRTKIRGIINRGTLISV